MKFSYLSNTPWSPSGYGQQARILIPRLAALGHQIAVIGYYGMEGGVLSMGPGVTVFPKRYHPYGNDIAIPHSAAFGAQFMLSNMDVWVMNPEEYPQGFKWAAHYPVDHDPMPGPVRAKIAQAWKRIAVSRFGVEMTNAAGLDCEYIPYVVDTATLSPRSKTEARTKLNLPADKWIVGTVAMNKGNPSRKNFHEMLAGFAEFHKRHPDTFYFLQTDRGESTPDTVNLPELGRFLGLVEGEDYGFCNQYQNVIGFPPEYFADLYSALDVHMLVSAGEGFGLPTIEAQACGCPVIIGDWTASSELCFAGLKVRKKDAEPFYTALASYQYKPHIGAVAAALEEEYRRPTDTSLAVDIVRAEYDADEVVRKCWVPLLAKIEAEIEPQAVAA